MYRGFTPPTPPASRWINSSSTPITLLGQEPICVAAIRMPKASVLITGPPGAGKEVLAKAIHRVMVESLPYLSQTRLKTLFLPTIVNTLLSSELFGHVKGAFTDAVRDKKGWFEDIGEGTLFLDEIGELPLESQAKLLRVIDYGLFTRVGDHEERKFRGRVLMATNRNLTAMVANGTFRGDLFDRINQIPIRVPSLAERAGEDIELLVRTFEREYQATIGGVGAGGPLAPGVSGGRSCQTTTN